MGQLGIALFDYDFIGSNNPAAWSRLSKTRIEFGLSYNSLFVSNNSLKSFYKDADFTGFTFGFPVQRDYGIGFVLGIVPYSNVSYKVKQIIEVQESDIPAYSIDYEGRGGISKMFFGSSYTLPFDLSVGATFDYYIGNLKYYSEVNFYDTDNVNAQFLRTYTPKGMGSTIGFISPELSSLFGDGSISNLRIGLSASVAGKFSADTLLSSTSSLGTDSIGHGNVEMKIPIRIVAGVSFLLSNRYNIYLDYLYQPWSQYTFNKQSSDQLRDINKISGGLEYRPIREIGATFWEQIIWRAGLSFEQTQYMVYGKGINQYLISGGLSLPLSFENTIDIGLQYAFRGTKDFNLFTENFIRLNLGLSLGETWFIRQDK
jgi:hypothetical protein